LTFKAKNPGPQSYIANPILRS